MRQDAGEKEEETGVREEVGGDRNQAETVAVRRTPASDLDGLGARERGQGEGKRRGRCGLLIGTGME